MAYQTENTTEESDNNSLGTCAFCKGQIGPDEGEFIIQSTECFHMVHHHCFRKAAFNALKD